MKIQRVNLLKWIVLLSLGLALVGCSTTPSQNPAPPAAATQTEEHAHEQDPAKEHTEEEHAHEHDHDSEEGTEVLALPALEAVNLAGGKLRVVATTSIIGDVVANVAGDAIDLTVLMGPGQDPHSFSPGAAQLTAVARAHIIFVNGWNLEERLLSDLETIGEGVPIAAVSANIQPLLSSAHLHDEHEEHEAHSGPEEHEHSGADPHVWFSIHNVEQWVKNIRDILSTLDPANASLYSANAEHYLAELEALHDYTKAQLATIPAEKRVLVTNHNSFAYFARDYGFESLGTVIPSVSTLAEPSAADLASLIAVMRAEDVCTVFTETTVSDKLAQTVAAELTHCDSVQVLQLYSGALGVAGSGAETYLGMFRANVDTIVAGLAR